MRDLTKPKRYLELRGEANVTRDDGSIVQRVVDIYGVDVRQFDSAEEQRVVMRLSIEQVNAVDIIGYAIILKMNEAVPLVLRIANQRLIIGFIDVLRELAGTMSPWCRRVQFARISQG